jgi:hypothetical protein
VAVTVTDAAGQQVTIEGIDSTRQPKWTEEELIILFDLFQKEAPYKDRDYSQFFRLVQRELPHRTLAGALDRIHDAQVDQHLPYYGALPTQEARGRDKQNIVNIIYALVEWRNKQAALKKQTKPQGIVDGMSEEMAGSIIQLLTVQNKILADSHKFLAGIYRRVSGYDAKFVQVEIMRQPVEITMGEISELRINGAVFQSSGEETSSTTEHITMVHTAADGTSTTQRFNASYAPVSDENAGKARDIAPIPLRPVQGITDYSTGIVEPRVPQGPPPSRKPDTFVP